MLVVMGVSGSGKSTVARQLADDFGWPLQEGDDLHPTANVDKMHAGHPLSDADRAPWLENIGQWIEQTLATGASGVITCSALKRSYRQTIARHDARVRFVYLAGSHATIAGRLKARHGHFMPSTLLDSQFTTLEEPGADEPAIRVDIADPPETIIREVRHALGLYPSSPTAHSQIVS